jgi:hypothetical protein
MNAVRTAFVALAVIGSAVLVSVPERAGADGPPPGAIEIVIEDEPDEDVSIGAIPDDPEPATAEAPPSAPPQPDANQPTASPPAGNTAPAVAKPPAAAPPQVQKPVVPDVQTPKPAPEPQKPCPDGKPHDGGKDGVIPASGDTNNDCDHSVEPPPIAAVPAPDKPAAADTSAQPKQPKPAKTAKPKSKKGSQAVAPRIVYIQPALANTDPNAPRSGYCRGIKFYDLIEGQPSWDPEYAGFTPAVNGACPPGVSPPVKVVVLSPPPADPGTSRTGYCYNGKYADLLLNQPSWDPQWAGATPATNGRC